VIAEWAANTKLGEATAAQFGYTYAPDPPFCGRKGRFRLAVIDGNVSADVVTLLAGALGPKERLLVCGTSLDLDASQALRELSPGSEARKIPASIIAEYELSHRWRATAPPPGTRNGISDDGGVVKSGSAVDMAPEAKPV
jgi:adenine-specific DNA-methyltransferase